MPENSVENRRCAGVCVDHPLELADLPPSVYPSRTDLKPKTLIESKSVSGFEVLAALDERRRLASNHSNANRSA